MHLSKGSRIIVVFVICVLLEIDDNTTLQELNFCLKGQISVFLCLFTHQNQICREKNASNEWFFFVLSFLTISLF